MIKKLSVVHPYYNKKKCFINEHINAWSEIPIEFLNRIEFIIVDDCSPIPIDIPKFKIPFKLKIYRINDNILWNCAGADNLGIYETTGDWIFRSDFDYIFIKETCGLFNMDLDDNTIYRPFVVQQDSKSKKSKNPNLFLINKNTFWKSGGYDEDFSGNYGYADSFWRQQITPHIKETVDTDNFKVKFFPSAMSFENKNTKHINLNLLKNKLKGLIPENKTILNFKWEKIYEN